MCLRLSELFMPWNLSRGKKALFCLKQVLNLLPSSMIQSHHLSFAKERTQVKQHMTFETCEHPVYLSLRGETTHATARASMSPATSEVISLVSFHLSSHHLHLCLLYHSHYVSMIPSQSNSRLSPPPCQSVSLSNSNSH